jgi:hypothetical protein
MILGGNFLAGSGSGFGAAGGRTIGGEMEGLEPYVSQPGWSPPRRGLADILSYNIIQYHIIVYIII